MVDQVSTKASPEARRVMIVDDDAEMRALLCDALARDGFHVREHPAGDGLLPLVADWVPDAVVLDKELAGSSGLDLLRDIRRRHPHVPVVLVTAFGGSAVEAEALRLGAAFYLDKPFRVARLLEVLRAVLGETTGGTRVDPGYGHGLSGAGARPGSAPADPAELAQEITREARMRGGLFLFTDYESTLRPGTPDRRSAGLPLLVRGALVALATAPDTRVVISSAEDVSDLEAHVNVPGVVYAGCRGLQIRGAGMTFCHPVAAQVRARLPLLARELSESLEPLPGIEVELKELGVVVHVHRVDPAAVPVIVAQVEELRRMFGGAFRVWQSESTVDLVPDVERRKDATARWVLEQWMREDRGEPVVVHVGGYDTDDNAGLALRRRGYAVHVGRLLGESAASHWVINQSAAIDLLARIAFLWSARSTDS